MESSFLKTQIWVYTPENGRTYSASSVIQRPVDTQTREYFFLLYFFSSFFSCARVHVDPPRPVKGHSVFTVQCTYISTSRAEITLRDLLQPRLVRRLPDNRGEISSEQEIEWNLHATASLSLAVFLALLFCNPSGCWFTLTLSWAVTAVQPAQPFNHPADQRIRVMCIMRYCRNIIKK